MTVLPLFPASVVGSMPRPQHVRELIEKPAWDAADERAMDAAIRYAVSMQEMAGLDVVTDGEWRRRSYIGVIAELAHGFTLEVNPADGRPWTVVTDKLAARARLRAETRGDAMLLDVTLEGSGGQALAGPVYFDFGANPLLLEARGNLGAKQLVLDSLHLRQVQLLDMHGSGRVDLATQGDAAEADRADKQAGLAESTVLHLVAQKLITAMSSSRSMSGSVW